MGELAQMGAADARALTDQIKVAVEATWELVKRAYVERAWSALGYDGWDDYCTREFGTSRLRLPREERAEVVASLRESGLSVRAIASATGVARNTVRGAIRDQVGQFDPPASQVTGIDGKTYTPRATTTFTEESGQVSNLDSRVSGDGRVRPAAQPPRQQATFTDEQGEEVGGIVDDRGESPSDTSTGLDAAEDIADMPVQPERAKPKRRPITDQARDAGWELRKAAERLERIAADDRFEAQKEKVTPHLRGHLTDAIASLQAVLDRLNS